MTFIGIDPGKDGGIAVLTPTNLWLHDTPTIKDGKGSRYNTQKMADLLLGWRGSREITGDYPPLHAVLETARAMPGQSSKTTAIQFHGIGLWEGILVALQIPHTIVWPQTWRKLLIGGSPGAGIADKNERTKALKASSFECASRLWPRQAREFCGPRGGVLDGIVEAALLAEYGRRVIGGTP